MKKYISTIILFFAAIIWGFAFVAQKAAAAIPPFTLIFARSIVAIFALIPVILLFDKMSNNGRKLFSIKEKRADISKAELLCGTVCGIFLFAASVLQQMGISGTDAGKTSFITALYVVIVPLYALFFGKKSSVNVWIGIAIAVIGFYLLCIKENFTVVASDMLIVLCAFIFAMQIMAVDLSLSKCDAIRLSLVQFATVTVLSLIFALIFEPPFDMEAILGVLPEILFLGIGSSGIAYTLQIVGQKNSEPAVASIILSLESVFGAVFSAIFLHERMLAKEYIGCVLVFAAVIISQLDFEGIIFKIKSLKKL